MLHLTLLDDFDLDAGLRWLAEGFMQRTGIAVDYRSQFSGRLPEEIETHLFRICQEALTNIARHCGASQVWIELRRRGNRIELDIADNGRGLPADGSALSSGLRLIGMRARARSAGGEVRLLAREGGGLRIEVRASAGRAQEKERKIRVLLADDHA